MMELLIGTAEGSKAPHRDRDDEVIRTHCGLQTEPLF
jgi:hypothetical protein